MKTYFEPAPGRLRGKAYHVIFESESQAGKVFDLVLIVAIIGSVVAVSLESIAWIRARYGDGLVAAEWTFTWLFTAEYVVRLLCLKRPSRYARSFFGVVDLVSILPSFVALLVPQGRYLLVIRILRLLRIFRVLKLTPYVAEANLLMQALNASRRKIGVFMFSILTLVFVIGATMYVVEGPATGFDSIPRSVYWAIVTLTTVGYGDIAPQSPAGQFIAAIVMVLGYAIIAVPTGIVTAEMTHMKFEGRRGRRCPNCNKEILTADAMYCRVCGADLDGAQDDADAGAPG